MEQTVIQMYLPKNLSNYWLYLLAKSNSQYSLPHNTTTLSKLWMDVLLQ
jgi:hypothetical protein